MVSETNLSGREARDPRCLGDLEEGVGQLEAVKEEGGFALAEFQTFSLLLPPEFATRLKELVGKRCGILKIDGSYRFSHF